MQHTLTIPMRAIGKQRPRVYGHRAVTPPETKAAEARIAAEWMAARLPMVEGPVALHIDAVYAMPTSWPVKRKIAALGAPMESARQCDCDNALKLCLDALNGVAYPDDRHVTEASVAQVWGQYDSLTITVSAIPVREAAHA
ncbi:MAG TPA: RusA family crossover junction endodeoxyribonuclease [Paracoccaceae bacterium]|nr:RusA family crossover junction endodeoxyribonuclease [Paracoccaceae bacterium]